MKLTIDELNDLVMYSEWIFDESFSKSEENNKRGIALHNKLKKFYHKKMINNAESVTLK